MWAWDGDWACVCCGCTKVHSVLWPALPAHLTLLRVFRSSNIPLRHPLEAARNPGRTPRCPRRGQAWCVSPHPWLLGCPVSEVSVQAPDVPLEPSPGISGSRGAMFSRLWVHMDADPVGWTSALRAVMGVPGHPQGSRSFCLGHSLSTPAPEPPANPRQSACPGWAHPSPLPRVSLSPFSSGALEAGTQRRQEVARLPRGRVPLSPRSETAVSCRLLGAPLWSASDSGSSVEWGCLLPWRLRCGSRERTDRRTGGAS